MIHYNLFQRLLRAVLLGIVLGGVLLITAEGASFTEFYCNASTGNNLNGGSDAGTVTYTSTNGNWSTITNIFTPTDGTNPVSAGVVVGQFASLYNDGAAAPTVYIARVTAVTNATNGTITMSSTAKAGTAPTTSATARTIKVGGCWKGPNAGSGFPITFSGTGLASATDVSGNSVRVNLKNNSTYSITTGVTASATNVVFQGYSSTTGDLGRATIDGGTSTIVLMTAAAGNRFVDLIFANNGTSGSNNGFVASNTPGVALLRCVVHDVRGAGIALTSAALCAVIQCEIYNFNTSNTANFAGIVLTTAQSNIYRNYIHDSSGSNAHGLRTVAGSSTSLIIGNIFDSLGGAGVSVAGGSGSFPSVIIANNSFYNVTGSNVKVEETAGNYWLYVENNLFFKSGAYAIDGGATFTVLNGEMHNNIYGSGTQANNSGNYHTTGNLILDDSTGSNDRIVYTANQTPWNAPTTGDFTLTGAAAFNVGRGSFTQTDGTNTGTVSYPDIGAAQHFDVGAVTLNLSDTIYPFGYLNHTWTLTQTFAADATVSISSGSLPPGLALSQPTSSSVTITGTPTTLGAYNFTTRITVGSAFLDFPSHVTINDDPDEGAGGIGGN